MLSFRTLYGLTIYYPLKDREKELAQLKKDLEEANKQVREVEIIKKQAKQTSDGMYDESYLSIDGDWILISITRVYASY